ncbi:hypothetical protein ASF61_07195 [Duganella sp. Leaf126]|uniref:hypothetical protein n=1 Tax=Duganella sp. Leaf126 TaxID=1736266 RepID=UPI0006F9F0E7|nr:hypothetical protein [Duganella sp. Leaf126]KQQ35995.1 hypothetical protein ASF61_07195 [Duganella sp. Leaf126]
MSDIRQPHKKPNQLRLNIHFDVNQETDQLSFRLRPLHREDEQAADLAAQRNRHRGVHADALYFHPCDEVHLRIVGGGARNRAAGTGFGAFQILECALITRPQVAVRGPHVRTQWSPPSPFTQSAGAIEPLRIDFAPHVVADEDNYLEIAQDWKHTLNVGLGRGMWELSFFMTVRILDVDGQNEQVRVLMFDPEAEVGGTGTLPTDGD